MMPDLSLTFACVFNDTASYTERGQCSSSEQQPLGDWLIWLTVYPHGLQGLPGHLAAFVEVEPAEGYRPNWTVSAECQIKVVNTNPARPKDFKVDRCDFTSENQLKGCDKLLSPSPLTTNAAGWLHNDDELHFEVFVKGDFPSLYKSSSDNTVGEQLWRKRKFTDMVIVTECGQDVKCHRSVLSSASEVFDEMLSHRLQESPEARIMLRDTSHQSASDLVEFLYTGKLGKDSDLLAVMKLGARFEIKALIEACASQLATTVSESNVEEVLGVIHFRRAEIRECIIPQLVGKIMGDAKLLKAALKHVLQHVEADNDGDWACALRKRLLSEESLTLELGDVIFRAFLGMSCLKPI